VEYIKTVREAVFDNRNFDIGPAVDVVEPLVAAPETITKFYLSTIDFSCDEDYLICHQVNAFIYSLLIGRGLKYSQEHLFRLGLSALLYDVGLFMIPEAIRNKEGMLTQGEYETIKRHTLYGRDILKSFDQYPILARVAFEHHERENGQGYPQGLRGSEICEPAKIIGLVDTYEAMIHNRPHRKAHLQHSSVKELIDSRNLMFAPNIIKAYLEEIGLFPIGSFVKLNNGTIGQVIQTNRTFPMKPIIRVFFNGQGFKKDDGETIDLEDHPILYVAGSLHRDDLPEGL
ncbi:MAG: HD domain-containing protein, partial [Deltaproteobacteria bacterium]|nr:HD domain-containing protein [Deltaproteobacteria bacterium]